MSNFTKIQTIYEFTNAKLGHTCGAYYVEFKGKNHLFIRNGDSVGAVEHYLGRQPNECISIIRNDVKQEFLEQLSKVKVGK